MLLGQVHSPDRIRYTLSPDEIGSGTLTLQCRRDQVHSLAVQERSGGRCPRSFISRCGVRRRRVECAADGEYRSGPAGGRINFGIADRGIADFGRNHDYGHNC